MRPRSIRWIAWLASFVAGCTSVTFHARVWSSVPPARDPALPTFPEQACLSKGKDCTWYADLKHLASRDVGIAFSGGGARAATAALGQLRALHALRVGQAQADWPSHKADWCKPSDENDERWIDRVRYISAVSGGAWTSTAYTFLQQDFDDCEFLGRPRNPKQLRPDELDELNGTMESAIGRGSRFEHLFGRYLRRTGSEAWGRAVADTFLTDFRLNQQRAWFTAGPASRNEIVSQGRLRWWRLEADTSEKFLMVPGDRRPFFISNATILSNDKLTFRGDLDLYPLEITPRYAGSAARGNPVGEKTHQFGGGFIDTFAMDATELHFDPLGKDATGTISNVAHRFTIADMMGATSSAAVETIARSLPLITSNQLGFAHYRVPPIGSMTADASRTYAIGDGAHLDNFGLLALLARRVGKIIVFVNTTDPIRVPRRDTDWFSADQETVLRYVEQHKSDFLDDMRALFDLHEDKKKVIAFDKADFVSLYQQLYALKEAKKPLVVCQKLNVSENSHFGVVRQCDEGCAVPAPTVCWVYLDRDAAFIDDLADSKTNVDTKHALSFGAVPTPGFPHYETAFGDGPQIVDLDARAISALAHLTAWTLNRDCEISDKIFGYKACPAPASGP